MEQLAVGMAVLPGRHLVKVAVVRVMSVGELQSQMLR
jgi:hypothetical protein